MNSNNYPSIIAVDHESSPRLYEPNYNAYPAYTDYPSTSKLEAFDYNYWPTPPTHNILNPINSLVDQSPSPPTNPTIETLVPNSALQINSTTTISSTHHHHHIHQHLYPTNETSPWLTSSEYQTSTPYRHYPYSNNHFYEQTPWSTSTPPSSSSNATTLPIKFESPYSPPPPTYFDSSHNNNNHHHDQVLLDSKEELLDSSQMNWSKSQLAPVPPKNPVNGKTRTRDKYRIVYTDRQRYELENEFIVSKYISIPRKAALSAALALSERQIKIWFQNRRAKERKLNKKRQEMCSRQLNNSTDADSASDGGIESPTYYQNYV